MVPEAGALTSSSIFIDSMIITVSPLFTDAPFEKHCLRRVPATGAATGVPPETEDVAPAGVLAAGAAAAGAAPAAPNATEYGVPFTLMLPFPSEVTA